MSQLKTDITNPRFLAHPAWADGPQLPWAFISSYKLTITDPGPQNVIHFNCFGWRLETMNMLSLETITICKNLLYSLHILLISAPLLGLSVNPDMARGYMRAHVSLSLCYWVFSRYVSGLMINILYLTTFCIQCTLDNSHLFFQPENTSQRSLVRAKYVASFMCSKLDHCARRDLSLFSVFCGLYGTAIYREYSDIFPEFPCGW